MLRLVFILAWLGACAAENPGQPDADLSNDPQDPSLDAIDPGLAATQCAAGTTNSNQTRTSNIAYVATHLTSNPAHYPFAPICLPITAAGQGFYVESKVIRGNCNVYDACETSLEIKCVNTDGVQLRPQLVSGENFLNGSASSSLFARLMFISTSAGPVTCQAEFFNHDHGIVGGTITVLAGSTFYASGPLAGAAATPDSGGGTHLTSATPTAALKMITGWHMPTGKGRADFIGDIQATECHVPYPSNATHAATQCTTSESGADATVEYQAVAVEEYPNGSTCHITGGLATTKSIDARTHHKMLYTQVVADHTPGCANLWRFDIYTRWISGRSFMVQSGPYGQGMVRSL